MRLSLFAQKFVRNFFCFRPPDGKATTDKQWFLVLNTQMAALAWLGDALQLIPDVVYRHNLGEYLSANHPLIRKSLKTRVGHEKITIAPFDFSIVDHFLHLEDNVDASCYGILDAFSVSSFLINLYKYPNQAKIFEKHTLRVAYQVMDPLRTLDAIHRMWIQYHKDRDFFPDRDNNPFDDVLYDHLIKFGGIQTVEDDLFLRALLNFANLVTLDLELSSKLNIPIVPFERLHSSKDDLHKYLCWLTNDNMKLK